MRRSFRDISTGADMRTPVTIYTAKPADDFFPGETVNEVFYKCFADVYPPSMKDLERDNEASVTMVTRHPIDKVVTTEMYFEINLPAYVGKKYNVVAVEDDTNNHYNIKLIGKLKS